MGVCCLNKWRVIYEAVYLARCKIRWECHGTDNWAVMRNSEEVSSHATVQEAGREVDRLQDEMIERIIQDSGLMVEEIVDHG